MDTTHCMCIFLKISSFSLNNRKLSVYYLGVEKWHEVKTGSSAILESMDCKGHSIFVLKHEHLLYLTTIIPEQEKTGCHVHYYANGYLIVYRDIALWSFCTLMLEVKKIFHEKFVT